MKHLIALTIVTLGGCALSPEARYTEATWQTLNVIDTGQTVTIARQPDRYIETNIADFGGHPTENHVVAVMVAEAVVHFGITAALDHLDDGHNGWHTVAMIWQAWSIATKANCVVGNVSQGIDLWGADRRVDPRLLKSFTGHN